MRPILSYRVQDMTSFFFNHRNQLGYSNPIESSLKFRRGRYSPIMLTADRRAIRRYRSLLTTSSVERAYERVTPERNDPFRTIGEVARDIKSGVTPPPWHNTATFGGEVDLPPGRASTLLEHGRAECDCFLLSAVATLITIIMSSAHARAHHCGD
ncbi:hypothetical protein PAPYR_6309 [Paratrimastix pyriformis]|uniref:Uncharacterized protein n=1 Tax=Paratrimastix pyriformis TaxID=342808 RepID=A0ABQ8UKP2_9EUKA|nr:hypothetical protein PAPYR_6309 [Paratrimastix pyriformis]